MNFKKMLDAIKDSGIKTCELTYTASKELEVSIFHHEITDYSISSQSAIKARGIYNGKLGFSSTEEIGKNTIQYLIDGIKETASLIEKEEEPIIFEGSKKYHKKNTYHKELALVDVKDKIDMLYKLEDEAYKASKYVSEVEVSFSEEEKEKNLLNSYGLNLKSKSNHYVYVVQVVCKKDDEIKSDYEVFFDSDFNKFDPKALAKKVVEKTVKKFDGISIKSKKYKCVLNQGTTASLLNAMVNAGFDAENIQKKSSLLVGKLNEKMFSNKITILEKPLTPNCFFRYFDDEGVACVDKKLVDKGIITSFLYNLETAKKDGTLSTGNGYGSAKISTGTVNLTLKPGKASEEDIIAKCNNGLYITGITGLHSGLNAQSGDFSLEAEGYMIKDGKIDSSLKLLTVGGNIYTLFNEVIQVANNSEVQINSVSAPSILIKSLKVSSL